MRKVVFGSVFRLVDRPDRTRGRHDRRSVYSAQAFPVMILALFIFAPKSEQEFVGFI